MSSYYEFDYFIFMNYAIIVSMHINSFAFDENDYCILNDFYSPIIYKSFIILLKKDQLFKLFFSLSPS